MSRPSPRPARIISAGRSAAAVEAIEDDDLDQGSLRLVAPPEVAGERLDKVLARLVPALSRSRLQAWIEAGAVQVDGCPAQVRQPLDGGETIEIVPLPAPEQLAMQAEAMALDIVFEDEHIAVIDKPPGLVVHPAAGHWSGTLANGLLARYPQTATVPRAGIVHRLDAGTSGLMVVALTLPAQTDLVRQLQARTVMREYWAVVFGSAPRQATIDAPLARDPRNPLRFSVSRSPRAKPARTRLRCVKTVGDGPGAMSWVVCRLDSGRTHQIRVHLKSIGHPLVGDPVYRRGRPVADGSVSGTFGRQALHAARLGLTHPASRESMTWFRSPPRDMRELMRELGFAPADRPVEAFS